jgi:crotonobetainyl-CoA:carnitine CoA-transferase CaiB-like acyl-CoA transferase
VGGNERRGDRPHGGRPLEGINVVELGAMAAAPTCGMLLASWGADVIKIERPGGDPARRAGASQKTDARGRTFNPRFELHNRGKRSVVLNLQVPAGLKVARRLVERADVFITNALPRSLRRFGLDAAKLRGHHPRLIYGQISSYGTGHEAEDRGSFDHGAFWAHSGLAAAFASDGVPPQPSGGMGDRSAGSNLAGAICAALFGRERTGSGATVSTSLVRTGIWMQGSDLSDSLATGQVSAIRTRQRTPTPLLNCFRDRDGRWFWLQVMHAREDWPKVRAAIDDPRLSDGELFGELDPGVLRVDTAMMVEVLDGVFAERDLDDLGARFDAYGVRWAPVLTREEVLDDAWVRASGAFTAREGTADDPFDRDVLADPCDLNGGISSVPGAPGIGEHQGEILAELGYGPSEMEALRDAHAFGDAGKEVAG